MKGHNLRLQVQELAELPLPVGLSKVQTIHLFGVTKIIKFTETENRIVVSRDQGKESM